MISIIICSRKADISQELKDNIAATIGREYELCVIDNSRNEYNIFTAYNEGVRRAKGDVLCFMHEDILFHNADWGSALQTHLCAHPEAGLIGVAGGHYLPKRPCYWNEPRKESVSYFQGGMQNGVYSTHRVLHERYRQERTFVAAIDGVFMAMPAKLFREMGCKWDDQTFNGFHFYDADMCMQIHRLGLKIEIFWDILLEHKSVGNFSKQFVEARQRWFEKWENDLPVIRGIDMTQEDIEICQNIMDVTDDCYRYNLLLESKAYKLGKMVLNPLAKVSQFVENEVVMKVCGGGNSLSNIIQ